MMKTNKKINIMYSSISSIQKKNKNLLIIRYYNDNNNLKNIKLRYVNSIDEVYKKLIL